MQSFTSKEQHDFEDFDGTLTLLKLSRMNALAGQIVESGSQTYLFKVSCVCTLSSIYFFRSTYSSYLVSISPSCATAIWSSRSCRCPQSPVVRPLRIPNNQMLSTRFDRPALDVQALRHRIKPISSFFTHLRLRVCCSKSLGLATTALSKLETMRLVPHARLSRNSSSNYSDLDQDRL